MTIDYALPAGLVKPPWDPSHTPTMDNLVAQARLAVPEICIRSTMNLNDDGYSILRYGDNGIGAHRFICGVFHGPPPSPELHAAHSCNVRNCINPHHLRWATAAENAADRTASGGHLRGIRSPRAQLTAEQVLEVRSRYATGERQADIARAFNVSGPTIGHIVRRESWAWLEDAS